MDEQNQAQRELTFGEKAVGLTFNPAVGDTHEAVNDIKTRAAAFIDKCATLRVMYNPWLLQGRFMQFTPRN